MRSQIDPRGMGSTLEYTFILERIAPGMARFRIAGQHLCTIAGMEVRGMPLTAFFTPVARPEVSATLEHVFDTPAVAELDLRGEVARTGAPSIAARMLVMPLRSDFGRVDRILGALMSTERGKPDRTPVRFEIASSRIRSVDGIPDGLDRAEPAPRQDTTPLPPGFGEDPTGFDRAPAPERASAPAPAWQDPALTADRPVDRFGTPRPADIRDRARSQTQGTPRPKAGGVPYLRLVKSDD